MSIFGTSDKVAKSCVRGALFLCAAFVTTVLFSHGLGHWPAYLQSALLATCATFLFLSLVTVYASIRTAKTQLNVDNFLELIPLRAFLIDEAGRLKYGNGALKEFVGPMLWGATTRDLFAIVHRDDESLVRKSFSEGVAQRRPFGIAFRYRRSDGSFPRVEARFQYTGETPKDFRHWLGVLLETQDFRLIDEGTAAVEGAGKISPLDSLARDVVPFMEPAISQLTAILVNSQACLRYLSGDSMNLSAAVASVERISRDAKDMTVLVKGIRPLRRWSRGRRASFVTSSFLPGRNLRADGSPELHTGFC
jgi:PAS domain-containing protein